MSARSEGSMVLLSEGKDGSMLASGLSAHTGPPARYANVAELLRQRPLSSVSVLVIAFRPLPKGTLLATLGRLNLEYPEIQKVVVLREPPPLPIAEYLVACGADLFWEGEEGIGDEAERLASVIRRANERREWIAA